MKQQHYNACHLHAVYNEEYNELIYYTIKCCALCIYKKSVLIYDTVKILCACEEKFASIILSCMILLYQNVNIKIYSTVDIVGFNLITSISLARVPRPILCNTSVSVFQLTGFFPLPVAHSWRISVLICTVSPLCLSSMLLTIVPLWSFRSKVPNWL